MAFRLSDKVLSCCLWVPGLSRSIRIPLTRRRTCATCASFCMCSLRARGGSLLVLIWSLRRHSSDPQVWRSISRGGAGLIAILLVLGVVGVLAFGVAFELFHELLFPGGNWSFPPTSLLIQLYPIDFWQLSAAAFGRSASWVGCLLFVHRAAQGAPPFRRG